VPDPSALSTLLGVGGPNLVSGEGWDVAPLVLAIALMLLMRWVGISIRIPAVLSAVAGALVLDLITDAADVSLLATLSILTPVFGMVAWRRIATRRSTPPQV